MRILVLGLGNDILSDDGVGLEAARRLRRLLQGRADVVECGFSGVALLDEMIGYDRMILIDAVQTGEEPAGTIREFIPADLDAVLAPSPHYAGIPELLALARELDLDFPTELRILAVEVADMTTIGGAISPPVAEACDRLVTKVQSQVDVWCRGVFSTDACSLA